MANHANIENLKFTGRKRPMRTGETVSDLSRLVQRRRKYRCIYADPPWQYNRSPRGAAAHHYRTMPLDEIMALPVKKLAAADCQLHLWVPNSFLFEASSIMDAWGFEFKSVFVWLKPTIGTGHYWRVATEFLLFGIKGDAPFRDRAQPNWMCLDRGAHSDKPDQVREMVERVSDGPRLELFGRRAQVNWTVFGDEIDYGLFDQHVVAIDDIHNCPASKPLAKRNGRHER